MFETLADTPERVEIRDAVRAICDKFDDTYWAEKDRTHSFPFEFAKAIADGGWLGIAMPEEYGGAGLGVTEASIMMQEVGRSAGAFAACSTVHINIFGLHSIVKHGTDEQKKKWLPSIIDGSSRACFGVTEPDAGLDTSKIKTRAVLKGDRYIVQRPEDLDQHGAAGRQDRAARAHHADRAMRQADRRPVAVLHRPGSLQGRGARNPQDGSPRGELEPDVLRRPGGSRRASHRRRGQGLPLHPRQPQSGTHPQRRRSGRHGPARARKGGEIRQRARRVRPADRQEPVDPASAWPNAGPSSTPPN